jgi:nucleotide-binding universal stress UspA family protein
MKTLVVAFDDSAPATRASNKAADLAQRLDAKVLLAHAVNPPGPLIGDFSGLASRELLEKLKQAAARMLEAEARRLAPTGCAVETVVLEGRPADVLADLTRAPEVAMVVIGRSGHGAITHALLGSVVNRLLTLSSRSVLVVP